MKPGIGLDLFLWICLTCFILFKAAQGLFKFTHWIAFLLGHNHLYMYLCHCALCPSVCLTVLTEFCLCVSLFTLLHSHCCQAHLQLQLQLSWKVRWRYSQHPQPPSHPATHRRSTEWPQEWSIQLQLQLQASSTTSAITSSLNWALHSSAPACFFL